MKKNPFIVHWNYNWLKLSDGSTSKEFFDHDEALNFLEEEMKNAPYPIATPERRNEYRNINGDWPILGQIECSRLERGVILLYGVSDYYIVNPQSKVSKSTE